VTKLTETGNQKIKTQPRDVSSELWKSWRNYRLTLVNQQLPLSQC